MTEKNPLSPIATKISERQIQSLISEVVRLQCKLNFSLLDSWANLSAFLGKESGGEEFNGDIWRDSAEARKPEPLNPAKSPFLKEAAFLLLLGRLVSPYKELVTVSPR